MQLVAGVPLERQQAVDGWTRYTVRLLYAYLAFAAPAVPTCPWVWHGFEFWAEYESVYDRRNCEFIYGT